MTLNAQTKFKIALNKQNLKRTNTFLVTFMSMQSELYCHPVLFKNEVCGWHVEVIHRCFHSIINFQFIGYLENISTLALNVFTNDAIE